jgi:hypothetical protein
MAKRLVFEAVCSPKLNGRFSTRRPAMSKYYTDDSLDKLCYRVAEKIHQAYEDSPTSYEVSSANRERDIAQNAKLIRNALADWKQELEWQRDDARRVAYALEITLKKVMDLIGWENDRGSFRKNNRLIRELALPVLDKFEQWYSRIREEKSNETN